MSPIASPRFKIYGIRHHGVGSARALVAALAAQQPDLILIEGPTDANDALAHAAKPEMKPPIALLVYNPTDLSEAQFFPFADFSPEWQALQFGFSTKTPARFFDLPLSLTPKTEAQAALFSEKKTTPLDGWERDPFARFAELAGFTDHERWWETTFELTDNQAVIFEIILDLMRDLRAAKSIEESPETLLREAFMRKTLRDALAEGFQNIAVVVGAWHAPILADLDSFSAKTDAALLKSLKKTKTAAAWIPWTFERLSLQSGYAAGIQSPAWYQILWENRPTAAAHWLTRAARLLREQDLDASAGHLIDAVRLAETTATIRGLPLAGIEELREAANATLGDGGSEWLQLIDNQLIIGERMGEVPTDVPVVPLQQDFEKQVKSLRWSELLKSSKTEAIDLDLRQEPQLKKSRFLHRAELLGLGWGQQTKQTGREQSTFHEYWMLQFRPEIFLKLIEVGVWGNTMEEAATRFSEKKIGETTDLAALAALLDSILKAELPVLLPFLLKNLQNCAALTTDALLLADAVPPLVQVLRYGSARKTDLSLVESVLKSIFPRVCIGLPSACANLNEDAAEAVFPKIGAVHRAASLFFSEKKMENDYENWLGCLSQLADGHATAPKLAGFAVRLLFDKAFFSIEDTAQRMQFELSRRGAEAWRGGLWLDGFLSGSGLLLVHQAGLWQILDGWVSQLSEENFTETLPLLRRTFSRFTPPERQKLLDLTKNQAVFSKKIGFEKTESLDENRARAVLPALLKILNFEHRMLNDEVS